MDHSAADEEILAIEHAVAGVSGVRGFHDLRTRTVGDFVLVDIHIEVDEFLSVRDGHQIAVLIAIFVFRVPEDSFTNDSFRAWAAIVSIGSVAFFNVVG